MIPTIGRIVIYTMTVEDALSVNRRRTTGKSIAERMMVNPPLWPVGAQAHFGNSVQEGDRYPMIIVKTWGDHPHSAVNGKVMLDGSDTYWATSRLLDIVSDNDPPTPGMWRWPEKT